MGSCFSVRSKPESPLQNGVNSTYGINDGNDLSYSIRTSAVLPTTPRTEGEILQSSNLKRFSYNDLQTATRNFHLDGVLGEGGFGFVFKGWIDEHLFTTGIAIAVKKLNQGSDQGHKEWLVEINHLGRLDHPNLVKLIGYCLEDNNRLLVYEFMPQGSLENHLFRRDSSIPPLSWNCRMKIALDAAKGLAFLHSVEVKVIHRDFKSSNILLDTNFNAKLSDFGLAKDGPTGDKSHVTTRVMGTFGYAAPEYLDSGHLTIKSDVYGFGVVLLEMLSGKRAIDNNGPSGQRNLVKWANPLLTSEQNWAKCFPTSKRKILNFFDDGIKGQYSIGVALEAANLAAQCLSVEPRSRPSMDKVVGILEQLQDSSGIDGSQNETSQAATTRNSSTVPTHRRRSVN